MATKLIGTNLKGIPGASGLPEQGFQIRDLADIVAEEKEAERMALGDLKKVPKKPEGSGQKTERHG